MVRPAVSSLVARREVWRSSLSAESSGTSLDDPNLSAEGFTIRTILGRIAEKGDLFAEVLHQRQRLPTLK